MTSNNLQILMPLSMNARKEASGASIQRCSINKDVSRSGTMKALLYMGGQRQISMHLPFKAAYSLKIQMRNWKHHLWNVTKSTSQIPYVCYYWSTFYFGFLYYPQKFSHIDKPENRGLRKVIGWTNFKKNQKEEIENMAWSTTCHKLM